MRASRTLGSLPARREVAPQSLREREGENTCCFPHWRPRFQRRSVSKAGFPLLAGFRNLQRLSSAYVSPAVPGSQRPSSGTRIVARLRFLPTRRPVSAWRRRPLSRLYDNVAQRGRQGRVVRRPTSVYCYYEAPLRAKKDTKLWPL